jgi:alkanesulfonate monooxygenase SsuD/methylene tetrahydromethanopterin reductase-like flavin-dependent oxidoreductase (luciferase family)
VQVVQVGGDIAAGIRTTAVQFGSTDELVEQTPFVLIGSVQQIVDKLERLRADLGINHVVVRDAEGFAPVVDALSGR